MGALLLASLLSLQTADLATSCMAFARGHVERNPIVPTSCPGAIAETAGVDAAGLFLLRHASPRTRALVLGASASIEAVIVYRNVRALRTPAPAVSVVVPTCVFYGHAC